ncbi:HAD-IA family hydrolase [Myxacorys almedinensis]|uniref:HAD-IA family hydrolase n=1 Tax=Myxacorys almedinensis A TaxID=2690445 RepID=A0A8J8CM74_9CYAN|nr:HAD family hydrolase [Myxacorys almedinensis]NDJ16952.1 HAD-IA family hydrolase [Myxacorys almedinensis A]
MKHPQVIFFDAVGTLFGVRGSVGEVYGHLAQKHGVQVDPQRLNQMFYQQFKASSPCMFPQAQPDDIPQLEYRWWSAIAAQTFQQAGVFEQFQDFSAFFSEVYSHFATADPWIVYQDVVPTLKRLKTLGIPLGIISNFDSRIYLVLNALKLSGYFSSITISTEVGAAKPDPRIFQVALEKHDCAAEMAWHVGDSNKEDYEAASLVGLRGVLLDRDSK